MIRYRRLSGPTDSTSGTKYSAYQFSDLQEKRIYRRLNHLLGEGPAAFFIDACRLMQTAEFFRVSTHTISHCLREVESSIRSVLVHASGNRPQDNDREKHKTSIEICLNFCQIPLDNEIAIRWLELPSSNGLNRQAHRDGLSYRPISAEFRQFWIEILAVFDFVLERLEAKYLSIHDMTMQLSQIAKPSENDLTRLRNNVTNSPTALKEFFEQASIDWLSLLRDHYFIRPPDIDPIDDVYQPWHESKFLIRAAKTFPQQVCEIVHNLPPTANPYVLSDICEIALEIPVEMAVALLPKIKDAIGTQYNHFLPIEIADVVKHLGASRPNEAFDLLKMLLKISPDGRLSLMKSAAGFPDYIYRKILEEYVPLLAEHSPLGTIDVLCQLIADTAAKHSTELIPLEGDENAPIVESLVDQLRQTCISVVQKDVQKLDDIIIIFRQYSDVVFLRMALYLLASVPDQVSKFVTEYLLNVKLSMVAYNEFRFLLISKHRGLSIEMQAKLRQLIGSLESEDLRLQLLEALKVSLPLPYRNPIETTIFTVGSPLTEQQLKSKTIDELIIYLASWNPNYHEWSVSKRGLSLSLAEIAKESPNKFANYAHKFSTVAPIYTNALLRGLKDAIEAGVRFGLDSILALCENLLQQLADESTNEDLLWSLTEITWLLTTAFEKDVLDYRFRSTAWDLLTRSLTYAEQYLPPTEWVGMSPIDLSYNTFPGKSLHAAVQYMLWIQRQYDKLPNHVESSFSLEQVPEVKLMLDRYLKDNSPSILAVFGRYWPWLEHAAPDWLLDNQNLIFPENEALWQATWGAYIVSCPPSSKSLSLLQKEYERAIRFYSPLGDVQGNHYFQAQKNNTIGHLMVFYRWGLLDFETGLLSTFYQVASDTSCAEAIQLIGSAISNIQKRPLDVEISRIKSLWENRIELAMSNPNHRQAELLAFSWWFLSDKLAVDWSFSQLARVFSLTGNRQVPIAHQVVKRIETLAVDFPLESITALHELLERVQEKWEVALWEDGIRAIITIALTSTSQEAKRLADELINILFARGYKQFVKLRQQ